MTYFLHQAGGTLPGGYPWSVRAVSEATSSEAAAESAWHTGWVSVFTNATLIAFFSTTTALTYTSTSTADPAFRQTTKTTTSVTEAGTSASEALPSQNCSIITLRTAFSTRWGRGRWYLPAPAVNALATTGPVYSTAYLDALAAALGTAFVSDWTPTLTLQILHKKGTKSGPTALSLSPVTGCDVSNKPGIQRRRSDKLLPSRVTVSI